MKKIMILLAGMLMYLLANAGYRTLDTATGTVRQDTDVSAPARTVTNTSDGVVITYTFSRFALQDDPLYDGSVFINCPGFGNNDVAEEPAVPLRSDMVVIPSGKTASVSILSSEYREYPYSVAPAREALPDNTYDTYTLDNVKPIKRFAGYFPSSVVWESCTQSYRGTDMLSCAICPVQYDYDRKKVRVYTKISYKVTFASGAQKTAVLTDDEEMYLSPDDPFLFNMGIGTMKKQAPGLSVRDTKGYLIITTPKYEKEANRFAVHKRIMGFSTEVIVRSTWTKSDIRTCVKDYFQKHKNLYYLLIIGGHQDVPFDYKGAYTDYTYGIVSGETDGNADIFRGRLPVNNEFEARTVVDKIIDYETSPVTDPAFYRTAMHCAYFQEKDSDGYEDRRYVRTCEDIKTYVERKGIKVTRVYMTPGNRTPSHWNKDLSDGSPIPTELERENFKWTGNAQDIISAINCGTFYVLHRDHGKPSGWEFPNFTTSHVGQLSNGNKLPVVFSINCHSGNAIIERNCFAKEMLVKKGGGAVAVIAATNTSYSGYNDVLSVGMFNAIWPYPGFDIHFPNTDQASDSVASEETSQKIPVYTLGQILQHGMTDVALTPFTIEQKENTIKKDERNLTKYLFQCYGDPSMSILTENPTRFKNPIIKRDNIITVTVAEGETVRINFYDTESGIVESYLGQSAHFFTNNPDKVIISIIGHNKIPFISYGNTKVSDFYIQNETITSSRTYTGDNVYVGSSVTGARTEGPVNIKKGTVTVNANNVILDKGTTVGKGACLKIKTGK